MDALALPSHATDEAPRSNGGARPAIGASLVAKGLLTEEHLEWALEVQSRTHSRLGSILVASGLVRRMDLYRMLAETWGVAFVDCSSIEPDEHLLAGLDPAMLAESLWVPVATAPDGRVVVATALEPTPARSAWIASVIGAPVEMRATSEWDIDHLLRRMFRDEIVEGASLGLWRRDPKRSARTVLTPSQRTLTITALAALGYGVVVGRPGTVIAISVLVSVAFLCSVAFKFVVCLAGASRENTLSVTDEEVAALSDAELPIYTVLVPCFHEANVVAHLIENLSVLDYPPEKLEILLLLEEDDLETRAAALAARPPATVTLLTVPRGDPQTKPKACNVGLFFARGEHLVIYDAEDRPDADQLKKAVVAFAKGGDDLVCVQAALNYFNADQNALTRLFTLEYSFWFDYMLPGLEALHLPIPLGGTSNHFRTDALRRLGGWDPFNVTEDADLGIRAAALGERVGVIPSTTYEEANSAYPNFVRQRSRWIKGYLQTSLVHLRNPADLVRTAGWWKTIGFAMLIGGTPLSFLCVPPLYALFVVSLVLPPGDLTPYLPGWVLWVSLTNLLVGNALMIYVSMMGVFKRRQHLLVLWALLNPVYWILHSLAAYKAVWQLIVKPHYWEKTHHGLDSPQTPLPVAASVDDDRCEAMAS